MRRVGSALAINFAVLFTVWAAAALHFDLPAAPSSRAQAPVFEITPVESWIEFDIKASVEIAGKFDKRDASLTFTSPDETTGTLVVKIQAASVDTKAG